MTPTIAELQARLPELTARDAHRLRRRLDGLRGLRDPARRAAKAEQLARDVEVAGERVERRRAAVPELDYPAELPVSQSREELMAAIRDHQVVIVAGETGSGKTTQLPKMCLELGRGVRGAIGHTQPRRLAARTVAERIAEEVGTPLGETVGYKVRFTDRSGEDTLVKVMTDGILLAELQQDRDLLGYDTIVVDEAHERSLNVDFILGYLKQLLPRRPDLKVIITSATIDPQRFSRHFDGAPVVEVSGRTFPVEVRYRPVTEDDPDRDQTQAICDAVQELSAEGPGDVLVFLSGEREIRDTADALRALDLRSTEVLPLYARLSAAEQHRVFSAHTGRRVVLATNVAETSLTVPGIRYVVDPGTARVSRYSQRTKVQRLPIEAISQASANQRKGRCGRVAAGVCIRLYSEEDFLSRPEFTDPEILRTNLASVILQMTALGLGDVAAFPFVEPPDRRNVRDGVTLLQELGALDPAEEQDARRRLTPVGRTLAQLPVDPRLGRMVLEADRNGALREVMVIAAALSIQDPRERPADHQQASDEKHARFRDEGSDFLAYVRLWDYLRERQEELSSSQFRRMCRAEFLNYLRVREWQDVYAQLRQIARGLGMAADAAPADPQRVHQSLLAGLLSHVGLKDVDGRDYLGARGARFAVFPGSALARKPPRFVMAAELVETSRLWARVVARVEPEWVESLAGHLVKRSYSEPHWEKKAGAVMAYEKVTLYGVPLVASRKVNYARVDPVLCRDLFIRHALVEGDWETHHAFWRRNRELIEEVEELEHRARRHDLRVDDQTLYDFYDARVGADVVSVRHFDSWWKRTRASDPELLTLPRSLLLSEGARGVGEEDYPTVWRQGDLELAVSYRFEPGADDDGVTVEVPVALLNRLRPDGFDWQVPGLRHELVTALIRSLPKPVRRHFAPAPEYAKAVLARVTPSDGPLLDVLGRELRAITGVEVPPGSWDLDRVPDHLRMTFRVLDARGGALGEGKDLAVLGERLAGRVRAAVSRAASGIERRGLRSWALDELPRTVELSQGGLVVKGFPALVDEDDSVAVRVLPTEAEQRAAMVTGTRRLLLLTVTSPAKAVAASMGNGAKLALAANPHGSIAALLEDCVDAAVDTLVTGAGGPAWDAAGFAALREHVRAELHDTTAGVLATVERILAEAQAVRAAVAALDGRPALAPSLVDVRAQLDGLVFAGFVTATGAARLPDVLRYLRAAQRRLERLPSDPARDRERTAAVAQMQEAYRQLRSGLPPGRAGREALTQVRWMIEELRVSYFAQGLGTAYPVSEKRILRALDQLTA